MTNSDEVARRVAERLGFSKIHGWQSKLNSDVWDALISSEMRVEELTQKLEHCRAHHMEAGD